MAKRKTAPTDASQQHQYTSTSESVKTRPRKKRVLDIPPPQPALPTLSHPSTQPQPPPKPPAPEHLLELTQIWNADKRTPSVLSRRAWALARNLRVDAVQRWWHRRRQTAKRAGAVLLEETYELDVGMPPVLIEAVKAEEQEEGGGVKGRGAGVARNTRGRAKRAKMEMQDSDSLLSSDTLVSSSPPARKRAYIHRDSSLPTSRSTSPLPPSSPPVPSSSPAPSSPPSGVQIQLQQEWCTRPGDDKGAVFTCSLCSSAPDSLPFATSSSTPSPLSTFVFPCPDDLLTPPIIPMRWCIAGRHYALDGSFIGPCVCCPVATGGGVLEDGLCPSMFLEGGLCLLPSWLVDGGLPSSLLDSALFPSSFMDRIHVQA